MPHIVVVEDDHLQEGPLAEYLESVFGNVTVETVCTEEEFRAHLPAMRVDRPDLVVMDVMLRWSNPRPDQPAPPEDVVAGGYYRAGLRCTGLMLRDAALHDVPVVLYTILERGDLERDGQALPPNASYVGKNSELDVLVRHIRSRMKSRSEERSPVRPS